MLANIRRLVRRRRPALVRALERATDDQALLCGCSDRRLACAG